MLPTIIISRSWRVATILAALFLSTTLLVGSFFIPLSTNRYRTKELCRHELRNVILQSLQHKYVRLNGAQMLEFDFEDEDDSDPNDTRTDEEKGLSHGYEGEFKIGDVVKVKKDIRIWSVKQHSKDGFLCKDYEGTVVSMALYGRKEKSLCSAITPVRVQFEVNGKGIPEGFFERKWIAHFAGEELEMVMKAKPVEPATIQD